MILTLVLLGAPSCGVEREDVKTLSDAKAKFVALQPIVRTVEAATKLPAPKWTPTLIRQQTEQLTYAIDVYVIGFKLEQDGDIHVVVGGEWGHTLIAELPAAECTKKSTYRQKIFNARVAFIKAFGEPRSSFRRLDKPVKAHLVGVLHFDKLHHQDGVAPNGIEIHPLLEFAVMK